MKRYQQFGAFFGINIVLLILANTLMPDSYTLGNNLFGPLMAAVFTAFVWNYLVWNLEPFLKSIDIKLKGETNIMLGYLGANFASIWILARFAFATGFGVASWGYVFLLALIANAVQYMVWKSMDKK